MNQERFRANLDRRLGARRAAFTLVELLMVIVVIGILSSLLVVASMSVLGTSREAATKATLSKINTMLKQRMAAFEVMLGNHYASNQHTFGNDASGLDERTQKILYRKKMFKKYFPQTWEEAKPIAVEAGVLKQDDDLPTATDSVSQATESAEVLFMFLTKTSISNQGEIGQDAFVGSEIADKDAQQDASVTTSDPNRRHPELVDSWGTPLRFYRWPCRLIKPNSIATDMPPWSSNPLPDQLKAARTQIPALTTTASDAAINTDPDNPLHLDLPTLITTFNYLDQYHFPRVYHTPLVVSAGADTQFGLESPSDYVSTNARDNRQAMPEYQTFQNDNPMATPTEVEAKRVPLYDNLTNFNALAGGSQ